MWIVLAIAVTNGLLAWVAFTALTRRWARAHALPAAWRLDRMAVQADQALQVTGVQEAFAHAAASAQELWDSPRLVLFYLSNDRSSCQALVRDQGQFTLSPAYWQALLQAPWQYGLLTPEVLVHPAHAGAGQPLMAIATEFEVDLFVPWIEHDKLICVTALRLGRALTRYDRALLGAWNSSLVYVCVNNILHELADHQHELTEEVERASAIVEAMPTQAPQGRLDRLAWTVHEPKRREGEPHGGFWDLYELPGDRLLVLAGEMVAQGLAAAMLSIAVRGWCDTMYHIVGDGLTPARLLTDLNRFLWRRTNPVGMSCIAALLDLRDGQVHHAVAGPVGLRRLTWRDGRAVVEPCPARGPLVGDRPEADYQSRETRLGPGDVLLLCSEDFSRATWQGDGRAGPELDPRFDGSRDASLTELENRLLGAAAVDERALSSTPIVLVRSER
ncbi:PP2C family protein-serine/threonine phosphatase [Haliangium sp.]|uniref:PP2C family protein-serine/threonine phosphatase n=1 Tax=Haliangium sp. TaxID=2663208 RepID=UPI003D0BDB42